MSELERDGFCIIKLCWLGGRAIIEHNQARVLANLERAVDPWDVLAANWHQKDQSFWQPQLGQYIASNSGRQDVWPFNYDITTVASESRQSVAWLWPNVKADVESAFYPFETRWLLLGRARTAWAWLLIGKSEKRAKGWGLGRGMRCDSTEYADSLTVDLKIRSENEDSYKDWSMKKID